jgi:hypothetical protein
MPISTLTGNTLLDTGYFAPCKVATTGPITLSGLQAIDGITLVGGDRVLVWQQTNATTNGIYAASSGNWVRTTDANGNEQFFDGMRVAIAQGAIFTAQSFQCTCTDDPVQVGISELTFETDSALQAAQQTATSTSSVAVGTGSKTFGIASGLSFSVNQWVLAFDAGGNAMLGQITAYTGGNLTMSSVSTSGSGTHNDWTIVLANSQAAAGIMPPLGTGNVTGPGSSTTGHAATFADPTGKNLADSGIVLGALASRSQLLYGDAGAGTIGDAALVPGAAPLAYCAAQPNDSLHIVNDANNPNRDIDITPGRCRDDADLINLQLAATMIKRLDQAWAAGGAAASPAGACDTGSKGASQTWHIYLIAKRGLSVTSVSRTSNVATVTSAAHGLGVGGTVRNYGLGNGFDGLAVITAVTTNTYSFANSGANVGATSVSGTADAFDVLASQSYPSPSLPSGWTAKQALGSILTDGSGNIRACTQFGDEFFWSNPPQDNVTGVGLITLTVPKSLAVQAIFNAQAVAASGSPNQATAWVFTPGTTQASAPTCGISSGPFSGTSGCAYGRAVTDASGRVQSTGSSAGGVNLLLSTLGWRDPRRRLF